MTVKLESASASLLGAESTYATLTYRPGGILLFLLIVSWMRRLTYQYDGRKRRVLSHRLGAAHPTHPRTHRLKDGASFPSSSPCALSVALTRYPSSRRTPRPAPAPGALISSSSSTCVGLGSCWVV